MSAPFKLNIEMSSYKTIVLDVDGVIFDSNDVKKKNIFEAVKTYTDYETANIFTSYFMGLSGVPREYKINSYFREQSELADKVLKQYNKLNDKSIYTVQLTTGAIQFIESCYFNNKTIIALSGGAKDELQKLFDLHNLNKYFMYIFGGPSTKEQNINGIVIDEPILYIGDSIVDYETAMKINAQFVFMSDYTSFENWNSFFKTKEYIYIINNFTELINN
jgi:phosphoglycolate phosphatase-like HAD superfamily hydrolase